MNDHQILLSGEELSAKGITSVDRFSEKEIRVSVIGKNKLSICGSSLKITEFSQETGCLRVIGKVDGVNYLNGGDKLLKRLLK